MNTSEVIVFVGLAALIIGSQLGYRRLSLRRLALPLVAVVLVGSRFVSGLPTAGGDLDFELALTGLGVFFGLGAGLLMKVERDGQTGNIMTRAGIAFAALWIAVFGGRLVFAWAATHGWHQQVAQFSIHHQITSSAAWSTAFILMALAMVVVRTLVVGARALAIGGPASLLPATR